MKNLFNIAFLLFILFTQSCSTTKYTGETKSTRAMPQGLIEVIASGYGISKTSSVTNAIENAFKNILTQGVPQSNQERPLLGNNALSVFEKNKNYFDKFFANELPKYILSQKILKYNPMSGGQASSEVLFEIKLDALRKKLETDKIISAFGI